ncbi:nitroreductase family protein [Patescibacteria group bacterium]
MHDLFKKRRSIRQYTSQSVSDKQIKEILTAAMVAPSANSLHPVDFIVVREKEKINQLAECGPGQQFVAQASVVIVPVADSEKSPRHWLIDVSLAAAHIYLEAASQGLATCWANVYQGKTPAGQDRETLVRQVLALPKEKRVIGLFPIGYPAEDKPDHHEGEYDSRKVFGT